MPSSGPNSLVTEQILSEELGLTPPATSTPYMTVPSALLAMMMTLTATIKSPSLILPDGAWLGLKSICSEM